MVKISDETSDNCRFLILGDMNSRVGRLNDFIVHDELDPHVNVLPDEFDSDVILNRLTEDSVVNRNGHYLIDFCKASGLRIMNGRVCNDQGNYTFVSHTGKSLVDYVIASPSIMNMFNKFCVGKPNLLSDHCTISFSLKCNNIKTVQQDEGNCCSKIDFTYKWDTAKINLYKYSLTDEEFQTSIHKLEQNFFICLVLQILTQMLICFQKLWVLFVPLCLVNVFLINLRLFRNLLNHGLTMTVQIKGNSFIMI